MVRFERWPLLFLFSAALAASAAGCAAASAEDAATSDAALSEYEGVAKNGTKVETDTTRTAKQSAKTRLVGYLPKTAMQDAADLLLEVDRWTAIHAKDGTKPFTAAALRGDTTTAGVRTVDARVTLAGDITLDLRATVKADDAKTTIHFVNVTGYKHWLAGQILLPGRLTIDVLLVPLHDGVIVDSTMTVKLEQKEERASEFTAALPLVFDWLEGSL